MERWRDRVAVVTGASSGIGLAIARLLAARGMRVVMAARRVERLAAVQAGITAAGGHSLALQTDVRDEAQIEELFRRTCATWGGVDVLVNNAGLGHAAPLLDGPTEQWREMIEVNLLGLCLCTRAAVADMRRRGGEGHVIHISSMAAHRVPPGGGVYAATKFGVRALTEALRQELLHAQCPIRVTAISPGFVETEFAAVYHNSEEAARKTYSRWKVLEPEDVANAVIYALSQPVHVQVHDVLLRPRQQPN
jgi:NADP-dependent 3-hydroxy acid dehydrogenase YdfG